jgi:hypothetical protein
MVIECSVRKTESFDWAFVLDTVHDPSAIQGVKPKVADENRYVSARTNGSIRPAQPYPSEFKHLPRLYGADSARPSCFTAPKAHPVVV